MKLSNRQLALLKTSTQLIGVSGAEEDVRLFLKEEFQRKNLPFISDNLGSIYAIKKTKSANYLTDFFMLIFILKLSLYNI